MHYYRLKKEAVPFFTEHLATKVLTYNEWEKFKVHMNALEPIIPVVLKYGVKEKEGDNLRLSGWNNDRAYFNFIIEYPHMNYSDYSVISKDVKVRELMDRMQNCIDSFYIDFKNQEHK